MDSAIHKHFLQSFFLLSLLFFLSLSTFTPPLLYFHFLPPFLFLYFFPSFFSCTLSSFLYFFGILLHLVCLTSTLIFFPSLFSFYFSLFQLLIIISLSVPHLSIIPLPPLPFFAGAEMNEGNYSEWCETSERKRRQLNMSQAC